MTNTETEKPYINISKKKVAEFLGVGYGVVDTWVRHGCPHTKSKSKMAGYLYSLPDVFSWVVEYEKQKTEKKLNLSNLDLEELKKERLKVLIQSSEYNLALAKQKIAPVAEISRGLEIVLIKLKNELRKLPKVLAGQLAEETEESVVFYKLTSAIDKLLLTLSKKDILKHADFKQVLKDN